MAKYVKKPVIIDAFQWTGENPYQLGDWHHRMLNGAPRVPFKFAGDGTLAIPTLEGVMTASPGDYIICGLKGEFYPCKAEIFDLTYEPAE